jgi:hypothetical protein
MPYVMKQRVTIQDVKELIRAHHQLDAVIASLRGTNWAGARACIAALAPVDQWVVDMYNRVEGSWLRYLASVGELEHQDEPAEIPAATQGQLELAAAETKPEE